jgi:hypothetical protein
MDDYKKLGERFGDWCLENNKKPEEEIDHWIKDVYQVSLVRAQSSQGSTHIASQVKVETDAQRQVVLDTARKFIEESKN